MKKKMKKNIWLIIIMAFFFLNTLYATDYTIENSNIRLTTDGKHISSLYDKERGLEHIVPDYINAGGIFGIDYVNANTFSKIGTINAGSMSETLINSTSSSLEFQLENSQAIVDVSLRLSDTDPGVIYTIKVEVKNSDYYVSMVDFPRFRISKTQGAETKKFLEPSAEGLLLSMNKEIAWFRSYPGKQSVQMGTFIASGGSVMVWADDTTGHVKSFGFKNSGSSANIAIRHMIPYVSNIWDPGYASRISVCGGTWQDAADIYRNWASEQYWSETKFRDRTDIPEIVHSPPLVISSQLDKENTSNLPGILSEFSDKYNAPIIYRPLGWEKYGNWVGIDYFPVSIGDDEYKKLNDSIKARGFITSGFIEGYHWTKRLTDGSDQVNNELASFFNDNAPGKVRTDFDGSIILETNANRYEGFVCRGSEFGKDFLQSVASRLFDRGVTQIHNDYDQLMGKEGPCWDKSHGHPVPYGIWEIDTMRNVYTDIINEAHSRSIDQFFITREYPTEVFNNLLHGGQERNFKMYTSKPSLIPLRQYIYHEYIPVIFGLTTATMENDIQMCGSILLGQIPSIAYWNNPARSPISNNTTKVLTDYYASMLFSKEFLLYGQMQHPSFPETADIMHNTWKDHLGNIGVFAVNTSFSNKNIEFEVPGTGPKTITFYRGHEITGTEMSFGGETHSWSLAPWRLSYIITTEPEDYPLASAGEDKYFSSVPEDSLILPGTGYDDVEITGYEWTKESGPECTLINENSDSLILKNLQEGEFLFKLTVTDNEGNTASDEILVTIVCESCRTPVVNAGSDRTVRLPFDTVQFHGNYTLETGSISETNWTKIEGPDATLQGTNSANLIVSNLHTGTYSFLFEATSDSDFSSSDTVNLTVLPPPDSIRKNTNIMIIDGQKDDSWCGPDHDISNLVMGWINTQSYANFLWDEDYLYIYVNVTDYYMMHDSDDEWWHDDAIEIFIDADNSKEQTFDANDFHFAFRWHWNNDESDNYEMAHGDTAGINWVITDLNEGYALETAIPWSLMNMTPTENNNIGIEIRINNDDDGVFRDAIKALFGFSGEESPNPAQFGTLTLGADCPVNTSINNNSSSQIELYPTITSSFIHITSAHPVNSEIYVLNVHGKIMMSEDFQRQQTLNISHLPDGVYIIFIQNGTEQKFQRIIKQSNH